MQSSLNLLYNLRLVDGILIFLSLYLFKRWRDARQPAPPPPGPRPWPIIGNLFDMPASQEWLTFAKWGQTWGDIVSASVFNQRIVILNSAQAAIEILDKKSNTYSNRPIMHMCDLGGWSNWFVTLQPHTDRFRNFRRLFYQTIGSGAAMTGFHPMEEDEARKFVRRILAEPETLFDHVRRTAGAVILRITYGYSILEKDDPLVKLADAAMNQFSIGTAPGGYWVNTIPALKYIPEWFPGAGFKRIAKAWKKTTYDMAEMPHQFVKKQMATGEAEPSYMSRLLSEARDLELTAEQSYNIKWSAASMYGGGADTIVATNTSFFLAMLLYPEVMHKAQAELDSVIGYDRLPALSDRDKLPYTNALVLEALRWHAVTPTGVAHTSSKDDVHAGYFIPRGSIIIPNVWRMLHDERVYSDPFKFNPNRFLGLNPEPSPTNVCFGFGRRICPGRVLAEASVFITCATTLATCNIEKWHLQDGDGKTIMDPDRVHEQTTGIVRQVAITSSMCME
ncbi:hypothetical protein CVT24_012433 [Panaeolus cyanescens]|uniref:Cytochrome P450 n=1 Tax=Panaeolus cyanescens TaxID=181874 RepID=A0A409YJ93_9AGAR|nr:hypothetical protein CVT24_012433 [Panaeolus cyanescens]